MTGVGDPAEMEGVEEGHGRPEAGSSARAGRDGTEADRSSFHPFWRCDHREDEPLPAG